MRPINTTSGLVSNKVVLARPRRLGRALDRHRHRAPTSSAPDWTRVARYGKPDGMISDDLDQNAFFAEPDGTVWLGSSRGLIRFQAGTTPAPEPPPPVVITDVRAGDRTLDPTQPAVLCVRRAQLQRRRGRA